MKIVVIEDEAPAARRLMGLIQEHRPLAEIVAHFDSVETAVDWLQNNPPPDLAFMDIQLADGLSFDIFEAVPVKCPVIFTTAYDEYAIKAFKVNSIDYLLKPIDKGELATAFAKYDTLAQKPQNGTIDVGELIKVFRPDTYKSRFLVKQGQRLIPVGVEDIAYFYAEDKLVFMLTNMGNKYIVDYTIEQLEGKLNPEKFFRANRKVITSLEAVKDVHISFNGKLKVYLKPDLSEELFVSRERAPEFKNWLGN
ncbi:MAG: response regulator transcription factor [Bacteroidetes bacterium]|nr:MAG: response regulator transcription factor [Bacteroidota bacterium]